MTLMGMIPRLNMNQETDDATIKAKAARRVEVKAKRRWSEFKRQAARKKLGVSVSEPQYIKITRQPCMYCSRKQGPSGIDRVSNSGEYTPANVAPCCGPCNMAKRGSTLREIAVQCREVSRALPISGLKRSLSFPLGA